jgi:hypothetical protein
MKKAEIIVKGLNGSEHKYAFSNMLDARAHARYYANQDYVKCVEVYEILFFFKREYVTTYHNDSIELNKYLAKRVARY